jgi:mannose-6-phosphate isomerase
MTLSGVLTKPEQILPVLRERIWGSTQLSPWFPDPPHKIGEVWFQHPALDVLVKFLFTAENLSVQVHPGDALARQQGFPRGKTEMWHILRATPSAQIALGFAETVTPDQVRRAAADGSIMGLLRWIPVHPGQTWFIPAGAVHAIGAGITLCEIQQDSDLTYRLYDYGRGRPLHLDESLRALNLSFRSEGPQAAVNPLVDCPYFQVNSLRVEGDTLAHQSVSLVIALEGHGSIEGLPFEQGQVFRVSHQGSLQLSGHAQLLTVSRPATTRI